MVVFQNNAQPKNVSKVINRGFEKNNSGLNTC